MLQNFPTPVKLIFLALLLLVTGLRFALAHAQSSPACTLPDVAFLGEGPGVYQRPANYDQLIIKKHTPFRFEVIGANAYTSTKRSAPPERAWACAGNCTLPAVYHDAVDLGYQPAGSVFSMVVIDDDNDQRLNTIVAGSVITPTYVHTITQQGMVQTTVFTTPVDAHWWLYAADSIGVVQPCALPPNLPQPPTETPTPLPSETPTEAPTATQTPTLPDTPTSTPTLAGSPTVEPGEMPTVTATPSPTMTFQIGWTSTPTLTPTPTSTDTPEPPIVVTLVGTLVPTNLDPITEPGRTVYLPVVDR